MENTILHQGGFTAVLESNGTVTTRNMGQLPSLDDIASARAKARYICEEDDISESDQVYLDNQGEL
jgi:hypothetical protein